MKFFLRKTIKGKFLMKHEVTLIDKLEGIVEIHGADYFE